jgi:hypothetical protein
MKTKLSGYSLVMPECFYQASIGSKTVDTRLKHAGMTDKKVSFSN